VTGKRKLAVAEVLFASVFSSTAIYLFTLQIFRTYWLWIADGATVRSTLSCAVAVLVWLFVIFLLRHLPQRFFLLLLHDRKVHASDFESCRRFVEHTSVTVIAGLIGLAGLLRIATTQWNPRPLLLLIPLVWIVFLRQLLALPDKTYKTNSFTQPGPAHESAAAGEPVSQALQEAETNEEKAREWIQNR
jgi:hypothetical protein